MKSTELAKVTTRFDFSFGLGNKCRKIFAVRLPNSEVKFSHMMCGNCSETFGKFASFTSCRMTASEMPKYAVGPTVSAKRLNRPVRLGVRGR